MSKHRDTKIKVNPDAVSAIKSGEITDISIPLPLLSKTAALPEPRQRVIEDYRHCPICWGGNGGYGTAYSTQGRTRYYKCDKSTTDKGPCGHTWTVLVKLEVIRVEHRVVDVEGQRG
jgi:hypothetical protein